MVSSGTRRACEYVQGLSDLGLRDSARLVYYDEDAVRIMAAPHSDASIVVRADDLRRIMEASTFPAVKVWVAEGLEDAVRLLVEEQRRNY